MSDIWIDHMTQTSFLFKVFEKQFQYSQIDKQPLRVLFMEQEKINFANYIKETFEWALG